MSNKFDQLAKGVAQSVTRRQALRRFGLGLVGMAMAGFALSAEANPGCLKAGHKCAGTCATCCGGSVCFGNGRGGIECFCT